MRRVQLALDCDDNKLSSVFGLSVYDTRRMLEYGRSVGLGEDDLAWEQAHTYINERIGMLLAVRMDIQHKIAADRAKRAARRLAMKAEGK
jgi:hypothetical protein